MLRSSSKETADMQGPRSEEALRGLDGYEQLVNTFTEQAKAYWRLWGALGEPMVLGGDATRLPSVVAPNIWGGQTALTYCPGAEDRGSQLSRGSGLFLFWISRGGVGHAGHAHAYDVARKERQKWWM